MEKNNVRAICLKEMSEIVKQYAMNSAAEMTTEHRKVVHQFTSFKDRTISHLNKMEYWHTRMIKAETYVSSRNPVVESTYAMNDAFQSNDKKRALGLYNCLVPKV